MQKVRTYPFFPELAFIALKNSIQKDLNISFDLEVTAFSGQVTYIVLTHMGEVIVFVTL